MTDWTTFLFGVIQVLGVWVTNTMELCKCCLISHPRKSREYNGSEFDLMNCEGWLNRLLICCIKIILMVFGEECLLLFSQESALG